MPSAANPMKDQTGSAGLAEKGRDGEREKPSLQQRLRRFFKKAPAREAIVPTPTPIDLTVDVRLDWQDQPFMVKLGHVALQFHPDLDVNGEAPGGVREWIVHAGDAFYLSAPKFVRIKANEALVFGRCSDRQSRFFGYDRSVADRHLKVVNRKGALTLQPLDPDGSIQLSEIEQPTIMWASRRDRLLRLPDVIGRPIVTFDDEALDELRKVNDIIATEAYRDRDDDGAPGGVIRIPDSVPVVIIGDVHAQIDNVLRVISEGGVLESLERGELCVVFLGDLLHSEIVGELEEMNSSTLALDLFCMLKRRFPKQVFYVHGNHEDFSAEIGKGGVPQALLFRKHLKKRRGKHYLAEVQRLFDQLAYVIQGNRFAACHAAPIRSSVDRQTLVNIRRYPGLQHELIWNRLRQSNRPAGYGKGSIKRFRQTLDLPKYAPVIVAHNPQSVDGTLWLNVGDIEGHHIVYSARADRLAVMVMSDGDAWPLELIPDPALALLNR